MFILVFAFLAMSASVDIVDLISDPITKDEVNENNDIVSAEPIPKNFAYPQTTFSSKREMFDFIKTLDFDRNPPAKRLRDFYNDEKKITEDKALRKGIELYLKGKAEKAADYFVNVYKNKKKYTQRQRKYAAWQVWHYMRFGTMDIFFNGTPSRMDRGENLNSGFYKCDTELSLGLPYLFVSSDPNLPSYDPAGLLRSITIDEEYNDKSIHINPLFTKDLLAAALYEAFPKGEVINMGSLVKNDTILFLTKPLKYGASGKSSSYYRSKIFAESVSDFFYLMDCMHLVARTKSNIHDKYGIGLTADEMYLKAKRLNPDKQMIMTDYLKGINIEKTDEQCEILLLRSAYYGHLDAIIELMPYIVETVQLGNLYYLCFDDSWMELKMNDDVAAELSANLRILDDVKLVLKALSELPQFKDSPYIWEVLTDEVEKNRESVNKIFLDKMYAMEAEKEVEERAKKKRREQFWSNVGTALLNGLVSGVNAYMQTQYQASAPMHTASVMTDGHTGSLADAMSQPGYFQNVHQQLLQQSMNQVQWEEMQEYNRVRENYQRMGRDLTLIEFRALQGQAIADLKGQGYDIIAEQKAINDDMHNFNRSQMNSGKENVERIKQQNAQKYGTSSTPITTTTSTNSYSTSSKSNTSSRMSSSTSSGEVPTNTNSHYSNTVAYNAHEHYSAGNINTQKNSYGNKIKNVNMAVKDGSSFRNVNLNGELYKKDGQYYVKIGGSFFKVEKSGGTYNSYIIYGAKAHYFNK